VKKTALKVPVKILGRSGSLPLDIFQTYIFRGTNKQNSNYSGILEFPGFWHFQNSKTNSMMSINGGLQLLQQNKQ